MPRDFSVLERKQILGRLKLNKLFREQYHEHRGTTDRVDYVWSKKVQWKGAVREAGSLFFSITKSPEGGWTFLGRHFNSVQGAKKEARRYCNEKAQKILGL